MGIARLLLVLGHGSCCELSGGTSLCRVQLLCREVEVGYFRAGKNAVAVAVRPLF